MLRVVNPSLRNPNDLNLNITLIIEWRFVSSQQSDCMVAGLSKHLDWINVSGGVEERCERPVGERRGSDGGALCGGGHPQSPPFGEKKIRNSNSLWGGGGIPENTTQRKPPRLIPTTERSSNNPPPHTKKQHK